MATVVNMSYPATDDCIFQTLLPDPDCDAHSLELYYSIAFVQLILGENSRVRLISRDRMVVLGPAQQ